jgi:AraC-like DNA-binding protein
MAKLKEVDEDLVRQLAALHCSQEEIARACRCSVDTLTRRFAEALSDGAAECRTSLKRMMFASAKKGSVPMQIWLSKVVLGWRDPSYEFHLAKKETQGLSQSQLIKLAKTEVDKLEAEKVG